MFSTFERIFNFAINTIVFLAALIITAVFWFLATFLFDSFALYFGIAAFGVLLGIIVGAYLYLVLSLPFQLSKKFDKIKDKVALKEYGSVAEFQNDIATFIIDVFAYPGITIDGGVFDFNKAERLTVNVDFDLELLSDLSEEKTIKKVNGFKAFYIPISLGNQNLGSMILFSKSFTLPILYAVLLDFENYMLDDQLLHVQLQ